MSALAGSRPRGLLFDFGGTLDSDGVGWKERFHRLWREEAGTTPSAEFDPAFYAADDALVGAVPPTLSLSATADRIAGGIAERLGRGLGDPARRVAARFTEETLSTLRSRAALLARLAVFYRLGIVSNFYGNLRAVCEESGLAPHFGAAIDSTEARCSKPGGAIFRAALDALDVAPADAVVIGDSVPRDMAGARALGIRHVLLRASAPAAGEGCCPEDRVIARLEEIEAVLS